MRQFKNKDIYKASNLVLDLESLTAWSYDWYQVLRSFNGLLVLNTHRYSPTTGRHVSKIRSVLDSRGLKYIEVDCNGTLLGLTYSSLICKLDDQIQALKVKADRARKNKTYILESIDRLIETRTKLEHHTLAGKYINESTCIPNDRLGYILAQLRINVPTATGYSPNYVADFSYNLGFKLTSEEVVKLSDIS